MRGRSLLCGRLFLRIGVCLDRGFSGSLLVSFCLGGGCILCLVRRGGLGGGIIVLCSRSSCGVDGGWE